MAVTATYTRRKPEEGILYNAVCQEWPKIRAASKAANDGHGLPDFIEDAVDDYRKCGDLKHGFVHVQCCSCKESLVIAFSCKQTGLCNSCDGKRMVSLGAHMVDEIIPKVRMRQWVITFPYDIRFLLAWNKPCRGTVSARGGAGNDLGACDFQPLEWYFEPPSLVRGTQERLDDEVESASRRSHVKRQWRLAKLVLQLAHGVGEFPSV